MSDVFVSYANEDRERARVLAEALQKEGLSVFWDRTIPPGLTWHDYIEREMQEASCVLVAWSEAAIRSSWVLEEAAEARKRGVLLPLLLDKVEPPFGFRSLQAADLSSWDGDASRAAFQQLVQGVDRLLGAARLPRAPSAQAATGPEADAPRRGLEADPRRAAGDEKPPRGPASEGSGAVSVATFMRSAPGLAVAGVVLVAVLVLLWGAFPGLGPLLPEREPGLYLRKAAERQARLTPTMVDAVPPTTTSVEEPTDFGLHVRGGCLVRDMAAGERLGWDDLAVCLE